VDWLVRIGEEVQAGQVVARLHHRHGRGLERARAFLEEALMLDSGQQALPLVVGEVQV
jgi:predicted deacylase